MELTPELYNAIKSSLSEHEKIVFGYPGIDGMRNYESLDDIPLELSGGDTVAMIVEYRHPTTHHIMKSVWAEFTIDISKFNKEPVPKYGKIKLSELRKRAHEWRYEDMTFHGPTAYNDTDIEEVLVEFAERIVDIDRDENTSEESSDGNKG